MKTIHDIEIQNLIEKAKNAKDRAYAPYSHFAVGACLKGATGAYFLGANVENSSYGASICAERVAYSRAIYEGERSFDALAIYTDTQSAVYPCGICLQVLSELCDDDMPVICAYSDGYEIFELKDLFPHMFKQAKADA